MTELQGKHDKLDIRQCRAIKCFNVDAMEEVEKREILKEAALLSQLRHPYLLKFYESFFEEEKFYMVTEHCEASSFLRIH